MKICVSCEADVEGKKAFKIKEDRVIKAVRAVKKAFNIAKNNELYVCEACLPKHKEKRQSFEKSVLFGTVIAVVLLVILLGMLLLSGRFDPWAIISVFVICGFILALPFFRYAPGIEGDLPKGGPASSFLSPGPSPAPSAPASTPPPKPGPSDIERFDKPRSHQKPKKTDAKSRL